MTVAVAPGAVAVVPVAPELRADPDAAPERGWLLAAATVGALIEAGAGALRYGAHHGSLVIAAAGADAELAALAFEEQVASVDRLRAAALVVPSFVVDTSDVRDAVGAAHLRVAEAVARLGGRPADAASVAEHEEAVLAAVPPGPARRTMTPTPPGAWRDGSCSAWTAWGNGVATTPSSPSGARLRRQRSRSGRARRRGSAWPPGSWLRNRASASATCSSTRGGPPRSGR